MIRGNFPLAMQGLVVVPLFGGYDERRGEGRIFYYDATGGRWEEDDLPDHRLRRPPREELPEEALAAGAFARGRRSGSPSRRCSTPPRTTSPPAGPTPTRGIFPIVADGHRRRRRARSPEDEVARPAVGRVLGERERG